MYPVRLGFEQAEARIRQLIDEGYHAEALVTSVFTFEKTVRRIVRTFLIARGFRSREADVLLARAGFQQLTTLLPCFEKEHRTLPQLVGVAWPAVQAAVKMRNKLVHGVKVFDAEECNVAAKAVLDATSDLRKSVKDSIGVDVWKRLPSRKKCLLQFELPRRADYIGCSD